MTGYFVSVPATPSPPSSPPRSHPTNTLTVTCLPKSFFDPLILDVLRNHFASYGPLNQWVPLQGFGRIIVVYELEDHAESAKQQCDPIVLSAAHDRWVFLILVARLILSRRKNSSQVILRVYRADPNPLIPQGASSSWIPETSYLQPPPVEKNFLISPPGSPPVGWEPIKEDPPNSCPLADDLMAALKRLKTYEEHEPGLELLLDPMDGAGVGVYVEDFDAGSSSIEVDDDDWVYGESAPAREKWRQFATAMPPITPGVTV